MKVLSPLIRIVLKKVMVFPLVISISFFAIAENEVGTPTRSYPSIFQAWNGIENRPHEDNTSRLARHDLIFAHPYSLLAVGWNISKTQPYQGIATKMNAEQVGIASQRKQQLLSRNSNLRLLVEIRYRDAKYLSAANESKAKNWWQVGFYPPDSPFWLKDDEDQPVVGWGEDTNANGKIDRNDEALNFLIDFTQEAVQDLVVEKVLELKNSGLFDGIMLDWWSEDFATSPVGVDDWSETILTREEELRARLAILQKIRFNVGDNFLILVNANTRKIPQSAAYVNGIFMESYKDEYNRSYNLDEIKQMERTLLWAEQNLKPPQINCLEGWRLVTKYTGDLETRIAERNSNQNQQSMRMITTLSLTHSDGYVLFSDDNTMPTPDHLHNWYNFWDIDLGYPVGQKAQRFQQIEGLFIREFEKGWTAYNRSGQTQAIIFAEDVTNVNTNERQQHHQIPDLDGVLFLKKIATD